MAAVVILIVEVENSSGEDGYRQRRGAERWLRAVKGGGNVRYHGLMRCDMLTIASLLTSRDLGSNYYSVAVLKDNEFFQSGQCESETKSTMAGREVTRLAMGAVV